jgi:hypothetical protein
MDLCQKMFIYPLRRLLENKKSFQNVKYLLKLKLLINIQQNL